MPAQTINGLAGPSESRKRARRADEDDDDLSVQEARPNQRKEAPKRARLSNGGSSKKPQRNRDVTPSEASDDDVEIDDGGRIAPPQTQYEEMRDGDFKHLENQERDDYLATQLIRRNRIQADEMMGDNFAALNGILQSITCVNFMCHEHLKVELGPLLNFVVGENGSGKSAILTAITLCLGGKASSTNRGGSLKNFIKEGCDRASLIVKIKNEGDDGYRTDLYGKSIIIERHFSRTGGSGFKVKSEMGATVSSKKAEVDEIVEYYALQVDNPLNVLSQDNARQFLNAATPAQKYKYFIEGVQLEQLDRDYRLVQEFLEQSEAKTPLQKERVVTLKAELAKAKKGYEAAQQSSQARRQLRLLRAQLVWAQVARAEQALADLDQHVLSHDQEIIELEGKVAAFTTQLQNVDGAITGKIARLEAAKREDTEFDAGLLAIKNDYEDARKTMEKLLADERNSHSEAKEARANRVRLEGTIEEEVKRLEDSNGDKPIELRKELEQARERRKEMEHEVAALKGSLPELQAKAKETVEKCQTSQQALKDGQQAIQQKTGEINNTKHGMERLQQGQGGKYDAYPWGMQKFVAAIAMDDGFRDKPIGPIGAHIQLLKPEWSSILEKQLGCLNDFVVTNLDDFQRLDRLAKQHFTDGNGKAKAPFSINVSKSRHIDTTGKEPDEEFDTIMRVLKFDNEVVRAQLIITNYIEQIILIKDRVKGEEVMFNGRPPRNVKMCFCEHDGKRNHGLIMTNRGGANFSTSPIEPHRGQAARMKTDVDAQVKAQHETLQYLQQELRDLQNRKDQLQREHEENMNELSELKREIQHNTKARDKLETQMLTVVDVKIQNIETDLDQFEGADGRLDGLREQLKHLQEKEEHYSTQYAELRVKKESFNAELESRGAALKMEKRRKPEYEKKVQDAENKVQRLQESRMIILEEKNSVHQELDSAKIERPRMAEARRGKAEEVANMIGAAKEHIPERVHIPEHQTVETIKARFQSIGRHLAEAEKSRGITDREAKEQYEEAQRVYEEAKTSLRILEKLNMQMKKTLQERLAKWRMFQRYVSSNARGQFSSLLSERSYRGQLLLDHKNKTLQVRVETEKTEKNAAGKNTKSLSGGEKSFSSICLLLAIWDAMGSPLRCLDEFDVFMDNVNRAISTNMLISAARRSVGRQFILITPNAIEGRAKLEKDVKIIRLTDPRQRRLADP